MRAPLVLLLAALAACGSTQKPPDPQQPKVRMQVVKHVRAEATVTIDDPSQPE